MAQSQNVTFDKTRFVIFLAVYLQSNSSGLLDTFARPKLRWKNTTVKGTYRCRTADDLPLELRSVTLMYCQCTNRLHKGSDMSAHVLLNLLNELGKRDKMRGLPSILSLFLQRVNKFNNTRARMLDSIYHMTLRLLCFLISAVKT